MIRAVSLVHLLATLTMFGAIWVVQVAHYPLFREVGRAGWAAYEAGHQARITRVVGPAMVAELVTSVLLVLYRPAAFPLWAVVAGALLVGGIWASTAFVQVPLHAALSGGLFDDGAHARLVATHWVRTAAWTARARALARRPRDAGPRRGVDERAPLEHVGRGAASGRERA